VRVTVELAHLTALWRLASLVDDLTEDEGTAMSEVRRAITNAEGRAK
jgi:hypothetical protein